MIEPITPRQTAHERNQIQSLNGLLASGLDAWIDAASGTVMVSTSKPTNDNIEIDDSELQAELGAFRYKAASVASVSELNRRVAERAAHQASLHFDRPASEIVFVERTDSANCIQGFGYPVGGFCYPARNDNTIYVLAAGESVTPNRIEEAVFHEIAHLASQRSETEVQALTKQLSNLYGMYDVAEAVQVDARQTDYSADYFHPRKQTMQWINY